LDMWKGFRSNDDRLVDWDMVPKSERSGNFSVFGYFGAISRHGKEVKARAAARSATPTVFERQGAPEDAAPLITFSETQMSKKKKLKSDPFFYKPLKHRTSKFNVSHVYFAEKFFAWMGALYTPTQTSRARNILPGNLGGLVIDTISKRIDSRKSDTDLFESPALAIFENESTEGWADIMIKWLGEMSGLDLDSIKAIIRGMKHIDENALRDMLTGLRPYYLNMAKALSSVASELNMIIPEPPEEITDHITPEEIDWMAQIDEALIILNRMGREGIVSEHAHQRIQQILNYRDSQKEIHKRIFQTFYEKHVKRALNQAMLKIKNLVEDKGIVHIAEQSKSTQFVFNPKAQPAK